MTVIFSPADFADFADTAEYIYLDLNIIRLNPLKRLY